MQVIRKILSPILRLFMLMFLMAGMGSSTLPNRDPLEKIRSFTRNFEFEFVRWTIDAAAIKLGQNGLGAFTYIPENERKHLIDNYFDILEQTRQKELQLEALLADSEGNAANEVDRLREQVRDLRGLLDDYQIYVESIVQEQIAQTLGDLGLGLGGKIFPPVLFKFNQLPVALIVSPRDVIRQEANIPLQASLTLDQKIELENGIDQRLDRSALVVNIGGISTYPSMILENGSLVWVIETVTHEWIHNYLFFKPLGIYYSQSQDLRTMNETTASILGTQIAALLIAHYYPELVRPIEQTPSSPQPGEPPEFDFRAEMHETRNTADGLLAQGLIEEAEEYMEQRRQVFLDHGYRIRKLNQAYFAFHGVYADQPLSAAGDDPVGDAVRDLWEQLQDPLEFLRQMARINSFPELEETLAEISPIRN